MLLDEDTENQNRKETRGNEGAERKEGDKQREWGKKRADGISTPLLAVGLKQKLKDYKEHVAAVSKLLSKHI